MRHALITFALTGLFTAGLGASDAMAKRGVKLRIGKSDYGKVVKDGRGEALYLFTKDGKGRSKCYGACADAWPPLLSKGKPVAGKGLKGKKLRTVKRKDGGRQVTYGGHPLYYYVDDRPGVILCQDVFEFGGTWLLVNGAAKAVR